MSARSAFLGIIAAALLTGCALQAEAPLVPEIPASYDHGSRAEDQWPAQTWYRAFGSDELDGFIDLAANSNTDLNSARARVKQADARARQAGAAILPSLDAVGTTNYLAGHSAEGAGHEFDWSAQLSASYEVDLWGKNRAAANSARQLARASRAERDTVALTVLAGVANSYFQLLALRERLMVAHANRDTARQLLEVVQARFDAAVASPIDLSTQKAAVDMAELAISELAQFEVEARTALSILLGRPPEEFDVKGQPLNSLREPVVAAGLPTQLLTRRPDVSLAEANLRAGNANLLAPRAALLPALSLTASGGVQNPALPATVLTIPGIGSTVALGANLIQPIFDHGRLEGQRDEVQARNLELLAAYKASIVAAIGDVENALGAIQHLNEAREFQIENVTQSERAFTGAKLRYEAGALDFLTMLEAQRTLYAARDQFIRYELARLQAVVGLCKALGGGWNQRQLEGAERFPTAQKVG